MQKLKYIFNAYIALFIYIFSKQKKDIWLIGGHNGMLYTDNAKVFYEYILDSHKDINIYWIVDKNSPIKDEIRGEKIIKGSIKNYLYFYHSKVNLFSDTFNSDIASLAFILPCVRFIYFKRFKVFLNHGRFAFKKNPTFSKLIQKFKISIFKSYNLSVASTIIDKIAMEESGIDKDKIEILGSPRDDKLFDSSIGSNNILIAPSWRGWLYSNSSLVDSDFYNNYTALLSNKKLNAYLKEYNINIYFYLHHMFHKFQQDFIDYNGRNITILQPNANISKYIKNSKLLITDYSSISADFYYLKKPVIFFQFDKDRYKQSTDSYINLDNDIFGDISFDINEVVDMLINTIEKEYKISPLQKEGEKFFVHFMDRDNCQRVYNKIREKI
jgi:CDP-glycerol glycerophosphotransferase (TagB/SpsB family)